MPRNITVTFADGSQHVYENAPDDITPEQVSARATSEMGKEVVSLDGGKAPSAISKFMNEAGAVVSKALQGLLPAVAAGGAEQLGSPLGEDSVAKQAEKALRAGPKAQTTLGKYAGTAAEGATAALSIPFGGIPKTLLTGVTSGLGAEAAGQVTSTSKNPEGSRIARLLGGLAGGIAPGIASTFLPNKTNLAREIMQDVRPQDFQAALARMRGRQAEGTPINLSQAMKEPSNIDSATALMASVPQGRETTAMLRQQPKNFQLDFYREVAGLPGEQTSRQTLSNQAQEATSEILRDAKKARTNAVTPLFEAAGDVGKYGLKRIMDLIGDEVSKPGADIQFVEALQQLGRQLQSSTVTGLPRTHAMDIKAALDDAITRSIKTGEVQQSSAKLQGQLKGFRTKAIQELGDMSPEIKQANALYSQITNDTINPLKQSIVGTIAQRGYRADANALESKLFGVFDRGTAPGQARSDILELERALRGKDPEIFQNTARTWLEDKMRKALEAGAPGDRVPEDSAARLLTAFGNPSKDSHAWSTTQDILAGMARSQNLPPDTYVKGFKNLMRLAGDFERRPAPVGGASAASLEDTAAQHITRNLGQISVVTPLRQPALYFARLVKSGVLSDVDRWLTTPEGAATLAKLGKQPYMSPGWTKTLQTLMATTAASQGDGNSPGISNQ